MGLVEHSNRVLEAIDNDSIVLLKKLLQDGYDINQKVILGHEYELDEPDESSILFYAIRRFSSLDIINLLIEFGADIKEINEDGLTALDIAIKFKRDDIVKLSIDNGIDVNISSRKSGITPLMLASCFSDTNIVSLLLENGAEINREDKSGLTAKDYAKKLRQSKMIEFLEANGGEYSLYKD